MASRAAGSKTASAAVLQVDRMETEKILVERFRNCDRAACSNLSASVNRKAVCLKRKTEHTKLVKVFNALDVTRDCRCEFFDPLF